MEPLQNPNGISVYELARWLVKLALTHGTKGEVWVGNGYGESNQAVEAWRLNENDALIEIRDLAEKNKITPGQLNEELRKACKGAFYAVVSKGTWTGILNKLDENSPRYDPRNYKMWLAVARYYMQGVIHGMEIQRGE